MTDTFTAKNFGDAVTRLLKKENFNREEMRFLFDRILNNQETEMHQGAFLAALSAKGETADEIAAAWEAIYELDTVKVKPQVDCDLLENSGTGMDAIKTFNISTAASIAASASGVHMARHGARAITSKCGTVDIVEALGVDVEVAPSITKESIEKCGIGVFNGMSPLVHPMALGRILSQISFGTILNTAASLANPAMPTLGVRGVYNPEMIVPVAEIMREIGYKRGMVIHGLQNDGSPGIDEAGTLGETVYAELKEDGTIEKNSFFPEDFGFQRASAQDIASTGDKEQESLRLVSMFKGEREGKDFDIVALNTGIILYVGGKAKSINQGIETAKELFACKKPLDKLEQWISIQNKNADIGYERFESLVARA
ncbi:MAG: anthranilate phosphoribosyltransferase [Clostridiales bacterium]